MTFFRNHKNFYANENETRFCTYSILYESQEENHCATDSTDCFMFDPTLSKLCLPGA